MTADASKDRAPRDRIEGISRVGPNNDMVTIDRRKEPQRQHHRLDATAQGDTKLMRFREHSSLPLPRHKQGDPACDTTYHLANRHRPRLAAALLLD